MPKLTISWSGFKDDHSGIARYEWCVDLCSKAACSDFTAVNTDATSLELTEKDYAFGSKMFEGKFYCATIRATNGVGMQSLSESSKSMYSKQKPQPGTVSDGADAKLNPGFQRDTTQLSACWSGFPNASGYFKVRIDRVAILYFHTRSFACCQ